MGGKCWIRESVTHTLESSTVWIRRCKKTLNRDEVDKSYLISALLRNINSPKNAVLSIMSEKTTHYHEWNEHSTIPFIQLESDWSYKILRGEGVGVGELSASRTLHSRFPPPSQMVPAFLLGNIVQCCPPPAFFFSGLRHSHYSWAPAAPWSPVDTITVWIEISKLFQRSINNFDISS